MKEKSEVILIAIGRVKEVKEVKEVMKDKSETWLLMNSGKLPIRAGEN